MKFWMHDEVFECMKYPILSGRVDTKKDKMKQNKRMRNWKKQFLILTSKKIKNFNSNLTADCEAVAQCKKNSS